MLGRSEQQSQIDRWHTAAGTHAASAGAPILGHRRSSLTRYGADLGWQQTLIVLVMAVDVVSMAAPAWTLVGFDAFHAHTRPPSLWLGVFLPCLWLGAMHLSRLHEPHMLGVGSEEFRRVLDTALRLTAVVAFISYALHANLSRGLVAVGFPAALALDLAGRYGVRRWLHRQHRAGRYGHRLLLVGPAAAVADLAQSLRRVTYEGFDVVGCCLTGPSSDAGAVPVLGTYDEIFETVSRERITAIAVASGEQLDSQAMRRLTWALERTGVQLLVSPNVTDCVGPRIHIRPVAGLPLLHIEEPEFAGTRRLLKTAVDHVSALLALLLLAPLLLGLVVAIRLTSPGPVLYRQTRIGRDRNEFTLYKFRTMYVDADRRRDELAAHNHCADGLLFKMRHDPRITPIGATLRRYSLDELPQLLNVLRGDMSLVGPRPPLPGEARRYGDDVQRRLLVRPGLTGLWQIGGRSDLTWEESVRLDLYYVENWSLTLDMMILCKTLPVVVKGVGAY